MTAALQQKKVDPKLYAQLDASLSRFAELMGKDIEVNTVARCRDAQRSAIDAVKCIEAAAGSPSAGDLFVWPEHRLMAGRQSDNDRSRRRWQRRRRQDVLYATRHEHLSPIPHPVL